MIPTPKLPPELSAQEVHERLQGPNPPVLLDVREGWEYAQGSLPGARHTPLSNFDAAVTQLYSSPEVANEAQIVTFCHHGVRSLRAAAALRAAGFADVASMAGGIDAWSCDVDGAVERY